MKRRYCQLKDHTCISSTTQHTPDQIWDREKLCLISFLNEPHIHCMHQRLAHSSINAILVFYIRIGQYTILRCPIHWVFFQVRNRSNTKTLKIRTCHPSNMHNPLFLCKDLKLATSRESFSSIFIIGTVM